MQQPSMSILKRAGLVLLMATALGPIWSGVAAARNSAHEALKGAETLIWRNEHEKEKRHEALDFQGVEPRDAKKPAEDSPKAEMQNQPGTPNQQIDRSPGIP
jgi:hypothetical protein